MARLEPLLSIDDLQANRLKTEKASPIFSIQYDDQLDTLLLRLIEPTGATAVYFVDDMVGLIFEIETKEVIGIHIDYFVEDFLPAHAGLEQAWRLSSAGHNLDNFGEIILTFEKMKPKVAQEVVKATSDVLRPQDEALAEALGAA